MFASSERVDPVPEGLEPPDLRAAGPATSGAVSAPTTNSSGSSPSIAEQSLNDDTGNPRYRQTVRGGGSVGSFGGNLEGQDPPLVRRIPPKYGNPGSARGPRTQMTPFLGRTTLQPG